MYQHTLDIFVIALPNNWDKILELGYDLHPARSALTGERSLENTALNIQ